MYHHDPTRFPAYLFNSDRPPGSPPTDEENDAFAEWVIEQLVSVPYSRIRTIIEKNRADPDPALGAIVQAHAIILSHADPVAVARHFVTDAPLGRAAVPWWLGPSTVQRRRQRSSALIALEGGMDTPQPPAQRDTARNHLRLQPALS